MFMKRENERVSRIVLDVRNSLTILLFLLYINWGYKT